MTRNVPAIGAIAPLHWTVTTNYRLRTISFAIMFASIVLHGWSRNYAALLWGYLTLHLLVYPHLMYWRCRRSAQSQKAEADNLSVDSLLFGVLAASLQFPLWISFAVYIASTLNITITRGARGVLQSQLLFLGGALVSIAVFGFRVSPETGLPTTLVCLAGTTYYMISIGITAFWRNQQLRETREALRLNERTLKQRIAEIQTLQAKLNEEMEARVEQRTREQVRSQKLASLGALVVGIAHEMNTPIGNAMLAASALGEELRELQKQVCDGQLRRGDLDGVIGRSGQATAMIVGGLERTAELIRSFKRVSVVRAAHRRRNFGLADLIGDVVFAHSVAAHIPRLAFVVDVSAEIRADSYPDSLSQLLDILIENARVHGFEGRAVGTISFTAATTGEGQLLLRVSDDGKGIAATDLPKIFDPFFTTRLGRGGSGLGLSVAWNIVTGVLDGTLEVSSVVGAGTTFALTMPLTAPDAARWQ